MSPDPTSLIVFAIAVTGLTMLPGATTMLVIRRVIAGGQRASIMTVIGGSAGVYVHAIVAALGLAIIFQQNETLRMAVRWVGAIYLIWLGAKSLARALQGIARVNLTLNPINPQNKTHWAAFVEGLITVLLSPEAALFYLSALSQFIEPGEWVLGKAILLASIHTLVRLIWYSLLSAFVRRIIILLSRPLMQRGIEAMSGILLIGFALRTVMNGP